MHFALASKNILRQIMQITANEFVLICVICGLKNAFFSLADFQSAHKIYGLSVYSGLVVFIPKPYFLPFSF